MIITRTPLRISIAGGGTDLPSYYRRFGGELISAAVNKYIYVGINHTFSPGYQVKYSKFEHVDTIDEVQHPIVRESLRRHAIPPSVEIISLADIPAGTGLGSSGTFSVGLLRALYASKRMHVTAEQVAQEACHIEIDLLRHPIGKQDQYIASYGGVTCFEFRPDDSVKIIAARDLQPDADRPRGEPAAVLHGILAGRHRYPDRPGQANVGRRRGHDREPALRKALGIDIKQALERGDTHQFGRLMHQHWEMKRKRSSNMSNGDINRWYEVGRDAGAIGGKMVGARRRRLPALLHHGSARACGRQWPRKG